MWPTVSLTRISRRACIAGLISCTGMPCLAGAPVAWHTTKRFGIWQLFSSTDLVDGGRYERELARLEHAVTQTLKLPPPRHPVSVVILRDETEFRKYVRTYFPRAPMRPALFAQGRGPGMVLTYRDDTIWVNLRHEATHGVLHACLPVVPLWLDEGLAEYFESPQPGRLSTYAQLSDLKDDLAKQKSPTLRRLESLTELRQMGQREYRAAWSWVYFLFHAGPAYVGILHSYLTQWQSGTTPLPISRQLGGIDPAGQAYGRYWARLFTELAAGRRAP